MRMPEIPANVDVCLRSGESEHEVDKCVERHRRFGRSGARGEHNTDSRKERGRKPPHGGGGGKEDGEELLGL